MMKDLIEKKSLMDIIFLCNAYKHTYKDYLDM